ncbi:MAG: hypothetical protein JNK35_12700, partial [Phycisphaerae bacterium]|nr:hypothetical protein [Phycisphaerae bacterium]
MRVQQVCCVHREKGTAYVVPVPARSYAEAAAKAAAAGHVVAADGGSAADASSVGSPLQDGQGADDRQRRTEALLHEIAGHLAALREGQSRLVARTHWPSAVTALLALALAALLLPSA